MIKCLHKVKETSTKGEKDMRKLIIKEWNEYGDAKVELIKITPPDEAEAKAKWDADHDARQERYRKIIAERG